MDLSANQLTGPLPAPWQQGSGNAATLSTLFLHSNQLSGALPALALANLANATLHNNLMSGARAIVPVVCSTIHPVHDRMNPYACRE